jgi:thiol-activated cytolysin
MKRNRITKTKSDAFKAIFNGKKTILCLLILGALLIGLTAAPLPRTQLAARYLTAQPKPTAQDKILGNEEAKTLVNKLLESATEILQNAEMESEAKAIAGNVRTMLSKGTFFKKNKQQIIDALFGAFESKVSDETVLNEIRNSWNSENDSAGEGEEEATEETEESNEKQPTAKAKKSDEEEQSEETEENNEKESQPSAKPNATSTDKILGNEEAETLVDKLVKSAADIMQSAEMEAQADAVAKKLHTMVSNGTFFKKNKQQITDALFGAFKSEVKDNTALNKIRTSWNSGGGSVDEKEEETTAETEETTNEEESSVETEASNEKKPQPSAKSNKPINAAKKTEDENNEEQTEETEGESNTNSEPSVQPNSNTALRQYIRSLKYDPRVLLAVQGDGGTLLNEKVNSEKADRKPGNGKIIRCLRTSKSLSRNFDDIAILQPTQGVIYPSALIYADQELVDGKPRPLTALPRAPLNLRLDLPGLRNEGSFTVANPTEGKVQSSVNKALNFWNNSTSYKEGYVNPSRSTYNSTVAYSSEQLALGLGFNAKWASGDASAQFNFSTSSEKNVVVAAFKQVFYTVTFDAPNQPEGFFAAGVTPEEATEAFNSETPPAYVSSVNYGRIIMFRMETDKSVKKADAKAALNVAIDPATSVGGDMSMDYQNILKNSTITVVTMGGDAEAASESVSAKSAADLMKIIKGKNAIYSKSNPGVPIAFTVKFLKDNSVAKMGTTTTYTTNDCEELPNLYVKVWHNGSYVAYFEVTWDEPGKPNQTRSELNKTLGFQTRFEFPGDATNIRLKMWNDTGLPDQREIFNKVLQPADLNKCYQVYGTTLGSNWNNDCQ